jgi:hypothetical protein
MFIRRKTDKYVVLLLAAGIFCFLSYRPRFRITAQMPAEFLDTSHATTKSQRIAEERLASAYWGCVINTIQWKYSYGNRLPSGPPPEFNVSSGDLASASDVSARERYWQKLQQVWNIPAIWTKQYEWDTGWTVAWTDDIKAVANWFYSRLPR